MQSEHDLTLAASTVDVLKKRLAEIDQKLSESKMHFAQCGSPKSDDSSDDDVGDDNLPWSGYILALASKIDALNQERSNIERELRTFKIRVLPTDDGY